MMPWLHLLFLLPFSAAFLPAAHHDIPVIARPFASDAASSTSLASSPTPDGFDGFGSTGFLVLAGGTGSRMKASMPKQFLTLRSSPVLHYSLHLFLEKLPKYCAENGISPPAQVVLVMDPRYQPDYQPIVDSYGGRLAFADPGSERQGSVENGLKRLVELTGGACEYVAVHDSARPLVTVPEVLGVCSDAREAGAAVLGVPCKATIKESADGETVLRTIPRERLWEVHTPQVVRVEALLRGFEKVEREGLEVTDDVSIIEALGEPVKLTRGEYTNLKITTPEDMDVASAILADRGEKEIVLIGSSGGGVGNGEKAPIPNSSSSTTPPASAAAVMDLSSSTTPTGGLASNLFVRSAAAGKSYNSMGGARLDDGYGGGRLYPKGPTPSPWHE